MVDSTSQLTCGTRYRSMNSTQVTKKSTIHCLKPRTFRVGSIYIPVLITSLIVATFAMASAMVAYRTQRDRVLHDDSFDLATAAESAIELALARIASDVNWRATHIINQEYGPFALGKYNLFYRLIDANSSLLASKSKDITIIGIARSNTGSYAISVNATPSGPAFTCLQHSVSTTNLLDLPINCHWSTDQRFFFTGSVSTVYASPTSLSSLTGDIYSTRAISGLPPSIRGSTFPNQNAITFPAIKDLTDTYSQLATNIPIATVPRNGADLQIRNQVISPSINPFGGGTNSQGIYMIDCARNNILISNCRIIGTLLLLNAGDASTIGLNTCIEPALPNYPSLIVDGKLTFSTRFSAFTEAILNTNLNPPGAPLYNLTNTTLTESYLPNIKGIVVTSDDISFTANNELELDGILVTRKIVATPPGTFRVFYNSLPAISPPPGFATDTNMRPIPGTYQRIATP